MAQLSAQQSRLLEAARIGHLATASVEGRPHVIPVCFASDGHFIYSVLDQKPKRAALTRLRRVRNIQANSQVSLVVDHYDEDWRRLWYILVSGGAELLVEGNERNSSIVLLRAKYLQYREMDIDQNPVIKITPDRVVSWGTDAATLAQ